MIAVDALPSSESDGKDALSLPSESEARKMPASAHSAEDGDIHVRRRIVMFEIRSHMDAGPIVAD